MRTSDIRASLIAAATLVLNASSIAQYTDPVIKADNEWRAEMRRKEELRAIEQKLKRLSGDTNRRLDDLNKSEDDSEYEFRDRTPEEIKSAQDEWNKKHPFTSSAERPDFAKMPIKVRKSASGQSEYELLQKQINQLTRKVSAQAPSRELAELRAQIEFLKNLKPDSTPQPKPEPQPQKIVEQSGYKPASHRSIVSRKMRDGTIMAIIGEKPRKFQNEAEFQKFLSELETVPENK